MISDLVIYKGNSGLIKFGSVCKVHSCTIDRRLIVVSYWKTFATLPAIQFENVP